MDMTSQGGGYDDLELRGAYGVGTGGGGSGSGDDAMGVATLGGMQMGMGGSMNVGESMNVLRKPMATNNFVTKLYQ
jgi:hypothetical protein